MSRMPLAVCLMSVCLLPATLLAQRSPQSNAFALLVPNVGNGTAFFKSVTGLKSETDVTEFREGGANGGSRKIAGNLHFGDITLKRPVSPDLSLAQWRKIVEDGQADQARRNATIVLYDRSNKELARWTIISAFPSRLSLEIDPDTGDPMEVLVLAADAVRRQ